MGFFTMGSSYWGKCYLFGLAFFVLAALMPLKLEWAWAPLALGTLWAVTLVLIARHVRRLGGAVQAQG
jgi:phosphatidylglycerophosphate synthase